MLSEESERCAEASQSAFSRGMQPFGGAGGQEEPALCQKRGMKQTAWLTAPSASLSLGDLAKFGREQAGIDGARPLERLGIDRDIDQRVEPTHRADVARFGSLDAQVLGLAIDALTTGTLRVEGLVEGAVTIQQGAHQPTSFGIDVLDTALALDELLMVARLAGVLWEEERTAKALGAVAVGMAERVGGVHAQACRAVGGPIGVAWDVLVSMAVERDSGNAPPMGYRFVDVPVIEGGISGHMDREAVKGHDRPQVQRAVIGHIGFIEGQGVLGDDHLTIAGNSGSGHARAIAPEVLFDFLLGAIGLLLVGGAFDADATIGVTLGLAVFAIAVFHRDAWVVLFDIGIDVLDVVDHDLAQARDLGLERLHGLSEQLGKPPAVQSAQDGVQVAYAGHGLVETQAIECGDIQVWTEAQFQHQQGVVQQVGPPVRGRVEMFANPDEQGFDVGTGRMTGASWARRLSSWLQGAPVEEGEERAVALHDRIGLNELVQRRLVKLLRDGYDKGHEAKLLSKHAVEELLLLCAGACLFVNCLLIPPACS